jgi:hypothetical protein
MEPNKSELQEMKSDARKIIELFNEALKNFTGKYPGFALHICDSQDVYDGSKQYSAEINGKL